MKEKVNIDWGVVLKYGAILFIITVICTLLLAVTNKVTAPVIAQQNEEKNKQAQQEVLPEAKEFESIDDLEQIKSKVKEDSDIIQSIDEAKDGDKVIGYTVKTTPNGYGGEIELLTGINTEGEITGISVLEQGETAGLGARSTESEFQAQYKGLSAKEPVVVEKNGEVSGNEIAAISGATITSNAITKGVNTSSEAVDAIEEDK